MKIKDLQKPNNTWPESARTAYLEISELVILQNKQLRVQDEKLTKQAQKIAHLKERLNLNSRNSSKPPSSDKKRPPKKKKTSVRKKGAQRGHKGKSREQVEPDERIEKTLNSSTCTCGGVWCQEGEIERFQVTEIPEIKPKVTEYLLSRYRCDQCGVTASSGYQPTLGYSRFGPRLHAFVTELYVIYRLTVRQIKAHLAQTFGIKVSKGGISEILKRCAKVSESDFKVLHAFFKADSSPKHVDETGWKIGGKSASLIGAMNHFASLFSVSKHRKRDDIIDLIGAELDRVIISDRARVYDAWANRQLCWSHILRDFTFISEASGGRQKGMKLVRRARQLFEFNHDFQAGKLSKKCYLQQAKRLRAEIYEELTALNMKPKLSWIAAGKVRCLLIQEEQLWTFLNDPTLPIHNNAQERELRNPVIKRKLSYGSDTLAGGQRYAQLLSVIRTLERQGKRWCDWFVRLCTGDVESLIPIQC
jgi:transposase-like protein